MAFADFKSDDGAVDRFVEGSIPSLSRQIYGYIMILGHNKKNNIQNFLIILLFLIVFIFLNLEISKEILKEEFYQKSAFFAYIIMLLLFTCVTIFKKSRNDFMYDKLLKSIHDAIFIIDKSGTVLGVNEVFSNITGYKKSEIIGKKYFLFNEDDFNESENDIINENVRSNGSWHGDCIVTDKDNNKIYSVMTISTLKHKGKIYYMGAFLEVTMFKEEENKLRYIANHDYLTQLPNKSYFKKILKDYTEDKINNMYLAVLFIDLDNFKEINDKHGHMVGDIFLKRIADRMSIVLEDKGIIARLGGDEFGVILTNLRAKKSVGNIINSLFRATNLGIDIGHLKDIKTDMSVGVTFYPQIKTVTHEELINQADKAMYIAKKDKFSSYHIYEEG